MSQGTGCLEQSLSIERGCVPESIRSSMSCLAWSKGRRTRYSPPSTQRVVAHLSEWPTIYMVASRSELILEPELHDARIRRGQDLSERRAAQRGVRIARPQPVEGIERLDTRLDPLSTGHPEQPHECEVDAPAARAQVGVVARIPVGADRRPVSYTHLTLPTS